MRGLIICLSAVALIVFAGCGDDSNDGVTPTAGVASPVASAVLQTPAACPTPPAERPFSRMYMAPATGQGVLNDAQIATSACSDTVTLTFDGAGIPAYDAQYEHEITECGSGEPVTTAAPAQIHLRLEPAAAHDDAGNPTLSGRVQSPNFASIKELKLTCDFEAVVAFAIGTAERYYTVTTASNPSRIIVEVYH